MAASVVSRIRNAIHSPKGVYNILDEAKGIVEAIAEDGAAAVPEVGAAEGAETVAAMSAVADVTFLGLLVAGIMILIALRWLEDQLVYLLQHVPWVGGKIAHAVRVAFSPLDNMENQAVFLAETIAGQLVTIVLLLIAWGLRRVAPDIFKAQPATRVSRADIIRIETEQSKLEQWDASLQSAVSSLETYVHGHTVPGAINTEPLAQTIHNVEAEVQRLTKRVTAVESQNQAQNETLAEVQSQLKQLNAQIHGVRSGMVTYETLQGTVERLMNDIGQAQAKQQAEINHNTSTGNALWPLAILLGGGAAGLKTLRSLESKPCQCPQFPDIPNELGAVVALYEFATHG